jgi:DNA-binding CsgD family transcriptional regulator
MNPLIPTESIELRKRLVNVIKDDAFFRNYNPAERKNLSPEKLKSILDNINGFIVVCNFTTGLYEYISPSVQSQLGYDLSDYSPEELTNFMFSIMYKNHSDFILNTLLTSVYKYLKENATAASGTDYRFTCCLKLKNVYESYQWYLLDTVIIEVNTNGFPLKTLITCTNIDQYKKDDCIYYNIMKKNNDGIYEVVFEANEDSNKSEYRLTSRETQIISLIGQGYTNKQIAHKLSISINTVQTHRKSVMKKTQCSGTAELVNFAFSRGLL